jgi:hypothetical protein
VLEAALEEEVDETKALNIGLNPTHRPILAQDLKLSASESPFTCMHLKFMGKGYMWLMLFSCICGCNVMQGDRQIQD